MSHLPPVFFLADSFYAGEECLLNLGWVAKRGVSSPVRHFPRRADLSANIWLCLSYTCDPINGRLVYSRVKRGPEISFWHQVRLVTVLSCHGDNNLHMRGTATLTHEVPKRLRRFSPAGSTGSPSRRGSQSSHYEPLQKLSWRGLAPPEWSLNHGQRLVARYPIRKGWRCTRLWTSWLFWISGFYRLENNRRASSLPTERCAWRWKPHGMKGNPRMACENAFFRRKHLLHES